MENRFDELAKAVAEGVSRREALRRFAGGLAGALLASLGLERRAFGGPGGPGPAASRCVNVCLGCGINPPGRAFGDCVASCEACGGPLNGSVCACPAAGSSEPVCCLPGTHCCSGACVDLETSNANCGACGHACILTSCCGGACVNTLTDSANCGGCGNVCPFGTSCCGGACVNTQSDPANCGGCGHVCPLGSICSLGRCCSQCGSMLCCEPNTCVLSTTPTGGTAFICTYPGPPG